MKRNLFIMALCAVLCVAMLVPMFASCGTPETPDTGDTTTTDPGTTNPVTEDRVINDTQTLILQASTFDGVFSPFFYSSAYDGDVVGLVNVGLLTMDATGAIVAGDQYDTVAKSYEIYYTNDLTNYTKKDTYAEGDYVVYEMVIKNGAKFSDGQPITADDVLFNYYVYLDPAYVGSSTTYTLPILGLSSYRTQTADPDFFFNKAAAILAAGETYAANDNFTEAEFTAYWAAMNQTGEAFAQEIVNYVKNNYIAYADAGYAGKYTSADIKASEGMQIAFGMRMWGFAGFDYTENDDETVTYTGSLTDITGKTYDLVNTFPTVVDYWNALKAGYADEETGAVDYALLNETETAGMDLVSSAAEAFVKGNADIGSIKNISGLVKGETTINGEKFETVKVILTEQNPKAILSLGVTVAPKHYYTAGFDYTNYDLVNYGVVNGINTNDFMDHLATFNGAPVGAGTYKFDKVVDGDVYFVRNDYHETMGNENVYNANIKNVVYKVVTTGAEYDSLAAGDIDFATVDATSDVMSDIADNAKVESILVDNLGYGYICINPAATEYGLDNLYTRIALTTVINLSLVSEYYPQGLADVIYRSMSQVSWAYPEGGKAIYEYDETLASATEWFKKAGYHTDADGKFTDVPAFDFYLPSEAKDHPAGALFTTAQTLLAKIGVTVNIKVDEDLIANIKTDAVPVYALAWQAAADPDMYQVYHYESAAESVTSNGIKFLYANGADEAKGTIEVTKLDGTKVTMTQKQALEYLAELIEQGVKYMNKEERKPIYEKALEVLAQLNIELPTYQRKNLYAYDCTVIDGATLSKTVTPYWGPLAEIWKVSFVAGTEGNQTITVTIG